MAEEQRESAKAAIGAVLAEANLEKTSEKMVRKMAAERAGLKDVSAPWFVELVKTMVREFVDGESKEEEAAEKPSSGPVPLAEGGDRLICQLSAKRNVSVQNFKGKPLVSIREYYEKDGKSLPTSKGISLTIEQWEALKTGIPAIKEAIAKLQ